MSVNESTALSCFDECVVYVCFTRNIDISHTECVVFLIRHDIDNDVVGKRVETATHIETYTHT